MSKIENYYFQDRFVGASIKCEESFPSLIKIIEALYVMVYGCAKVYSRQRGYHIRVRFTEKIDSRKFSARLSTFFKRKSGYIPLRLTVVEQDEDEESLHYHYAIILNDRHDKISSLNRFMAELFAGGFLSDYKVIAPKIDPYGHHLRVPEERDSYFKWMTYLAKVETKAVKGQVWSCCRAVSRALKEWNSAGKPDLRKQLSDYAPKDDIATVDVFEFMQVINVPAIIATPRMPPNCSHGAI
jgi:hypothetical protein